MPKTPGIKSYYDNVKDYLSNKLMMAEQQLRRAEDNGCPEDVLQILHQVTKQLRRIYRDLILTK